MTLEQHLLTGYRHAAHGGPDPVHDTAREIPSEALHAEIQRLEPMLPRDHVSRVWTDYMKRVLDLKPLSGQ